MKPDAFTESRPGMINEDHPDPSPDADVDQEADPQVSYPRELNKQGLLVLLGVSLGVVALLVIVIAVV
ncbi:hypothetical protein [Thiohalophilus thiocyanatoxydans]|nr:hypothetical protein [Thiohalophilus thiocyanatoxydans]